MARVATGLDQCLASPPPSLADGARFALLANVASVDARGRHAWDALADRFPNRLTAIFSPQHGLFGEQQANMIESPHEVHPRLRVPIHSLYSETRRPTSRMLDGAELLVVDLQDVGARVYTFLWTVLECLEACAERAIPVLVLDRPNPLGGVVVEGPLLERSHRSFVGNAEFPMRHGLTMAEAVRLLVRGRGIGVSIDVVRLDGWTRDTIWPECGRPWVPTSPNLPRWESVAWYPGMVLLEGTNLSEGRGTTTPFELVGAPYLDAWKLADDLGGPHADRMAGAIARPIRFVPTFDKWRGVRCEGVQFQIDDFEAFRPYRAAVAVLAAVRLQAPDSFRWNDPPYEYDFEHAPIDILSGGTRLRQAIDGLGRDTPLSRLPQTIVDVDADAWRERVGSARLY